MADPITLALGIAKLAPMVAGWIGGDDAEDKANKVLSVAESVTGLSGQEAVTALENDPELVKFFEEAMLEEMRIHTKDRQDARSRDLEVRKMNGGKNNRANFMLGAAFFSLVVMIGLMWWKPEMPGVVMGIFSTAIGSILKMLSDGFQFEFGSSRGSKEKNDLIKSPK